jgi:SAM-dependent methyltransferase
MRTAVDRTLAYACPSGANTLSYGIVLTGSHHKLAHTASSAAVCNWYATEAGRLLAAEIKNGLDQVLPDIFGYHAVQLGCMEPQLALLSASRIKHRVRLDIHPAADVVADSAALPFKADCIDLILLMHTLDFAADPQPILREVERVLIPEGRLILVGLNPWSLYGLWGLLPRRREQAPWCGHFYSATKLRDWLSLLGLFVESCDYRGFRPPLQQTRLLERLALMERVGRRVFPFVGAARVIVARKRVATLTPLKPRWHRRGVLVPGKLGEPAARLRAHGRGG